jgi:hypothetical protein
MGVLDILLYIYIQNLICYVQRTCCKFACSNEESKMHVMESLVSCQSDKEKLVDLLCTNV